MKRNFTKIIGIMGVLILSLVFIGCESKEEKEYINQAYEFINERDYNKALELLDDTLGINEKNKRALEIKGSIEKYIKAEKLYSQFKFEEVSKILKEIEFNYEELKESAIDKDINELKEKSISLCNKKGFLLDGINQLKSIENESIIIKDSSENYITWGLKDISELTIYDYDDSVIRIEIDTKEYPTLLISDTGIDEYEGAEEIFEKIIDIFHLGDGFKQWFKVKERPKYPLLDEYQNDNMYAEIKFAQYGSITELKFYGSNEECTTISEEYRKDYYSQKNDNTINFAKGYIENKKYELALEYFNNLFEDYITDEQKETINKMKDMCNEEINKIEEERKRLEEERAQIAAGKI